MWVQCVLCDRYVEIDDERAIAKRFRKRPDYTYLCSRCGGGLADVEQQLLEPGQLPPELAALERSTAPSFASWSEPSKPRQGRHRGEESASAPPFSASAERAGGRGPTEGRRPNPDRQRPAGGGPTRPVGGPAAPQNGKPQQNQGGERAQGQSQGQSQGQGGGRNRRRGRSGRGPGQGAPGQAGAPGQPGGPGQQNGQGQSKPAGQGRDNGRHRGHGRDRSHRPQAGGGPESQPQQAGSARPGPVQLTPGHPNRIHD